MKKKITGLFLCLLLSFAFILTGCDLFPRNMEQYLNKPVCTITYEDGKVVNITTEEYINAFNSYGAQLVQNGATYKEAADQTVEVLISRKVILEYAKGIDAISSKIEENKQEFYDDIYASLVSNLDTFITAVRTDWKLDAPTTAEADSQDTVLYTPYAKTAEVVKVVKVGDELKEYAIDQDVEDANFEYRIKLFVAEDVQSTNFTNLEDVISAFKNYSNPKDTTNNSKIKKEAYRRFLATLKTNEEGLNLSKNNDEILQRYVNKLYKGAEEDFYVKSMETYYKVDNNYSTITVKQVLDKYKSLMLQSKYKYETNNTAYDTAMLESFADVNYAVDDNYFFVSHILVKFTEEQQAEYDSIKDNAYLTPAVKQQKTNELLAQLNAKTRDKDGKIVEGQTISATQLLANLKRDLAENDEKLETLNAQLQSLKQLPETEDNAKQIKNVTNQINEINNQKAETFREYMYTYGEDPGTQNAEYMYVIGNETSKMVESFTNESRKLNEKGVFGATTELVPSEYGVHIIFYGGKVENLFTVNNIENFNLQEQDIEKLVNTKLNALNNKTVFDKVFEMLSDDGYTIFENMQISILKKGLKIEKHKSVYENL